MLKKSNFFTAKCKNLLNCDETVKDILFTQIGLEARIFSVLLVFAWGREC